VLVLSAGLPVSVVGVMSAFPSCVDAGVGQG